MLEFLNGSGLSGYMPHGHCYLWEPALVASQVATNALIGLAYLAISFTLAYLVRRVRDLPFQWVYVAFGIFIVACGFTHFMDVWVIWRPNYWLDAAIRAITAVASVGTAILLVPLVPKALALADAARLARERGIKLEQLNAELSILYEKTRETVAEAIPHLVWTATPDGAVDYLNHRWAEYVGELSLGWDWRKAVHPEDAEGVVAIWRNSLSTGQSYETELRIRHRDGSYRWFVSRGLPLRAHGGAIVKWFGTCSDVHDRKLVEEERERLLAQSREELRARDVFLAIAAHELKTPLTPLRLEVEDLLRHVRAGRADKLAPERLTVRLGTVERQVGRLERLIGNLLDVSRLTSGRFKLDREAVELADLVRGIVGRHRAELEAAGCPVTLRLPPSLVGHFDRLRLDEVFTNLLVNAMTYGRGKPIDVELSAEPGLARLAVSDQGIGVAPEDQQRIFERFERAASERHSGGLGLGLWLVRQIVEAHGGTVRVESQPSQGARFIVELPLE